MALSSELGLARSATSLSRTQKTCNSSDIHDVDEPSCCTRISIFTKSYRNESVNCLIRAEVRTQVARRDDYRWPCTKARIEHLTSPRTSRHTSINACHGVQCPSRLAICLVQGEVYCIFNRRGRALRHYSRVDLRTKLCMHSGGLRSVARAPYASDTASIGENQ